MKNYSHRSRILITGGAGCLGSHLCERLLDDGHDIICLDSFVAKTCNAWFFIDARTEAA